MSLGLRSAARMHPAADHEPPRATPPRGAGHTPARSLRPATRAPRAQRLAAALLVFLVGACASSGAVEPAERAEMVPANELPDEHRELLVAYAKGGERWRSARVALESDPELARFLVDNLVVDMVRGYLSLAKPGSRSGAAAYQRAQDELVRWPEVSSPVLAELLVVADDVVATLAAQTLERIGRPAVRPVAERLEHERAVARRRALEVLGRLPHGAGLEDEVRESLIRALESDEDWTVRAEAARCLGLRGARDRETARARAALEQGLSDGDPYVARTAAEGLAHLGDPRAIPALIRAVAAGVRSGEPGVVRMGQQALEALSGARDVRDLAGWRAWWGEHRDRILRDAGQSAAPAGP